VGPVERSRIASRAPETINPENIIMWLIGPWNMFVAKSCFLSSGVFLTPLGVRVSIITDVIYIPQP